MDNWIYSNKGSNNLCEGKTKNGGKTQYIPTLEGKKYSTHPDFAANTAYLKKITFDYESCMNTGEFKYNVEKIAEFMVNNIKKTGLLLLIQSR